MSRTVVTTQPCGCKLITEPTGREVWGELCVPHDAETKALHAEAQRQHDEERRVRALEEEFT